MVVVLTYFQYLQQRSFPIPLLRRISVILKAVVFHVYGGNAIITNSTFSINTGLAGAAVSNRDKTSIINSTIISNTTSTSTNGSVYQYGGTLTMTNSIVAYELGAGAFNCSGTITDGGYNLEDANDCSFTQWDIIDQYGSISGSVRRQRWSYPNTRITIQQSCNRCSTHWNQPKRNRSTRCGTGL